MNNVLLWIGGVLVAVLCALFAVPHFVDWTSYRGVFEEEASRVLGREVRVAGTVNLRLLPTPFVRFEKVRLADVVGQTGEPFFRADDFTLWLSPAPLLRGAIEAREIELRRPTLKLRLNAEGGGNWQALSISRTALPFIPSDVALQSVVITEGTVSIDDSTGRELVRVDGVTGELNVAALDGPFKFKGVFNWAGARHELKASTTTFEADGGLRMKAQISVPATTNTYTFDGRLADLSGRARLEGQLTGQLGFMPSAIGGVAAAAATDATPARVPIELRAAVTADTQAAQITDLGLAFEQDGKPQLVAGSAKISWQGTIDVQTELTARWIDVDQLLGGKGAVKPPEAFQRLAAGLTALAPARGRGLTSLKADQLTLGGESLGGAAAVVESSDGVVRLSDLQLGLPGGTRAQLKGLLPTADTFDGDIVLRGANLARLLTWFGHGAALVEGRSEGVFSLKSKLAIGQQSIAFKDAFASLGSAVITGGIAYRWSDRPRLDVVIEGDQIDLGLVSPRALDLKARLREVTGGAPAPAADPAQAAPFAFDVQKQDATLRIRAGRLLDADRDLRDVDVDATLINGRLILQRLRFNSGNGLEIDAEGEISNVGARARGGLRGTLGASDKAAIGELVELFEQTPDAAHVKRMETLAPARLAWTVRFGEVNKEAAKDAQPSSRSPAEIWLDGAVLGRRMTATVRLAGGVRDWRQNNLQLTVAIERPDWQQVRAFLTSGSPETGAAAAKPAPPVDAGPSRARLQLKAAGQPDQSLSSYLKLEDETFDAGLSGRLVLGSDAITSAEGELQVRAADAALALAALGLSAANLPAVGIDGAVDLALKDGTLKVTPSALEVAGAIVGGEVLVTRVQGQERHRIEGRIVASQASIPRLFDLLADARAPAQPDASSQIWPGATFDFAILDRFEGRVRLEAADLDLTPALVLTRGSIVGEFAPGKVDIVSLEGDLLGTRMTSRWLVEKAAAGANLNGTVKVDGARLDLLPAGRAGAGKSAPGGKATVTATVSGRGLTPRSLVAALTGKGEIDVAKGETGGMSPLILRRVSDDAVNGRRPVTVEAIEQGVVELIADPAPELRVGLGNRKLAFDIADGVITMRPFTLSTPEGRATNRTTIELARLKIDSEWKLEEQLEKPGSKPAVPGTKTLAALPPITIVFVGPLSSLGALEPVVSVDSLVRELSVRRIERDVEELERLRRVDEERAKIEAERRAAAAAAAAIQSAAPAQPAATPAAVPAPQAPPAIVGPIAPAPLSGVPQVLTPAPQQGANGTPGATPIEPLPPVAGPKQRPPTSRELQPRQVPSSQQLDNSRTQDVFKRQSGK